MLYKTAHTTLTNIEYILSVHTKRFRHSVFVNTANVYADVIEMKLVAQLLLANIFFLFQQIDFDKLNAQLIDELYLIFHNGKHFANNSCCR